MQSVQEVSCFCPVQPEHVAAAAHVGLKLAHTAVCPCRRARLCAQVSPWVTACSCVMVAVGLAVW